MPETRHWQAASRNLNQIYWGKGSYKTSLFSPETLKNAGGAQSTITKADVHKQRAKLVLGNIFTAGLVNLYHLHKSANILQEAESNAIYRNKVDVFAHTYAAKFGLNGGDLNRRMLFDMGVVSEEPSIGETRSDTVAFNVNYSRMCSDPVISEKLAELARD